MAQVPIVQFGSVLVATFADELDDESALGLQEEIGNRVVVTRSSGVLLDISALQVVDSFISRVLGETAAIVRVLGADVAIVGMRPAVAITMVELGLPLEGIATARHVEAGIRRLSEARVRRGAPDARARSHLST